MSKTIPDPWVSPSGSVRLSVSFYRDFTPHLAEVVVLGCLHGSSGYYRLPECRSALLKGSRIPASTPLGRSMRDWLESLVKLVEPEEPETNPTESTKTII
jgi:hypothetical protein